MSVHETVHGLWSFFVDRDWTTVATYLSDDCLYTDTPVGPAFTARGPGGIVKRLMLASDPLAEQVGHGGLGQGPRERRRL